MAKKRPSSSARSRGGRQATKSEKSPVEFLSSAELENLLADGKRASDLVAILGEQNYQELRELAEEAKHETRRTRKRKRVLILPGLMGSTLGTRTNTIWIDPLDVMRGNLAKLKMPDSTNKAKDVIPFAYLKLKLRLQMTGFDVDYWHYDWRKSVPELGDALKRTLSDESASEIFLVAHSMGGMVARAALAKGVAKVKRLIMLGTPNFGSFEPILAVRAKNGTVQSLAKLDFTHDSDGLANIFRTFPGLIELMPSPKKFDAIDLYDAQAWPTRNLKPSQDILLAAKAAQEKLLDPSDPRCFMIAGVNQETTVGLRLTSDKSQFVYNKSNIGDGTVPLDLAILDPARTYYQDETHSGLPNNRTVTKAVVQLLRDERVTALKQQVPPIRRVRQAEFSEDELAVVRPTEKKALGAWTPTEIREIACEFISAGCTEQSPESAPTSMMEIDRECSLQHSPEFRGLVVSRQRQRRFDINLARGDITQLRTRAVVLGMFQAVRPSGPAAALDRQLGGTISEFVDRRMFAANVGEIQILPTNRQDVRCELIVLAGLGAFDTFNEGVLRRVAENVGRCLVRAHVDEIGAVPIGTAASLDIESSLNALLGGFFNSIREAPPHLRKTFRGVTVCEYDEERYERMRSSVYHLASTGLFEDYEVTLDEVELESPVRTARTLASVEEPVYLIARSEGQFVASGSTEHRLNLSILPSTGKQAATVTATQTVTEQELQGLVHEVDNGSPHDVKDYGQRWADLVLPPDIRRILEQQKDRHWVVVHDRLGSRVPWESLHLSGTDNAALWSPAAGKGVSRTFLAQGMAAAAWMSARGTQPTLKILMIVNPTKDLPGTKAEEKSLRSLFDGDPSVEITRLVEDQATKEQVVKEFESGQYDVVHYAGHAYYNTSSPSESGILCSGHEVLSGGELLGITNLPTLMFFNACQAARVRKVGIRTFEAQKPKGNEMSEVSEANSGMAEAFLRGGVANYVGTYWPVSDFGAAEFSEVFYRQLLAQRSIGAAMLAGRKHLMGLPGGERNDWANYVLFGDSNFRLREEG